MRGIEYLLQKLEESFRLGIEFRMVSRTVVEKLLQLTGVRYIQEVNLQSQSLYTGRWRAVDRCRESGTMCRFEDASVSAGFGSQDTTRARTFLDDRASPGFCHPYSQSTNTQRAMNKILSVAIFASRIYTTGSER